MAGDQGSSPVRPSEAEQTAFFLKAGIRVAEEEMSRARRSGAGRWNLTIMAALIILICPFSLPAQDTSIKQQVTAIREAMAKNKSALLEYTWQEQETISIKDQVRGQRLFQVEFGRDGKLLRTPLGLPDENFSSSKENRGMQDWLTEKKKRSLQSYAREMKELAQTYAEADPDLLRVAYERGDVAVAPTRSDSVGARLVIHNYVKPGDSVTLDFDAKTGELQHFEAASYLPTTRDPVSITTVFSKPRNEPNHIDEVMAVARKKHLSLSIRNLAYQRESSDSRNTLRARKKATARQRTA